MRKCLVVVPTFDGPYARPFRSFMEIMYVAGRACPDWNFAFQAPERSSLPAAMNHVGNMVLAHSIDALIVFDDDCFPPYDCIPRLLKHYDDGQYFVAGVGITRNYPHVTTIARKFAEGHTLTAYPNGRKKVTNHQWLDDISGLGTLAEVDFCGVPVAMMARKVFAELPAPWFGLHGEDGGVVTHDVFFCTKLRAAGLPVLVDTTLKCGHLAEAPIVTFENRDTVRELVG